MNNERAIQLLQQYTEGNLQLAERTELENWLETADKKSVEAVMDEYANIVMKTKTNNADPVIFQRIKERISETELEEQDNKGAKVRQLIIRIAVAASVLLTVGLGSYFLFFRAKQQGQVVQGKTEQFKNDVNPGRYKARLQLADNRTIVLDSASGGELATQGNTTIINKNGELVYSAGNESGEIIYNTLSTARGEIYATTLSDGSKIWLNSATTLKFPVAFAGNERRVEINGEAYFEVAKNPSKPFIVTVAGKGEVEVLGTHFNINSYVDEASINTTLLEGSVKVTGLNTRESAIITPHQQAQINTNGQLSLNSNVDIEEVMAWKNGIFNFNNADLQIVLRQLSRWYDVDIVYEGAIPQRQFQGKMQRDLKLSQVLRILEKNNVHFRIEGKKLIVMK